MPIISRLVWCDTSAVLSASAPLQIKLPIPFLIIGRFEDVIFSHDQDSSKFQFCSRHLVPIETVVTRAGRWEEYLQIFWPLIRDQDAALHTITILDPITSSTVSGEIKEMELICMLLQRKWNVGDQEVVRNSNSLDYRNIHILHSLKSSELQQPNMLTYKNRLYKALFSARHNMIINITTATGHCWSDTRLQRVV